jgi:uncharacterized membrane protein YfcA
MGPLLAIGAAVIAVPLVLFVGYKCFHEYDVPSAIMLNIYVLRFVSLRGWIRWLSEDSGETDVEWGDIGRVVLFWTVIAVAIGACIGLAQIP